MIDTYFLLGDDNIVVVDQQPAAIIHPAIHIYFNHSFFNQF